MLKNWIIITFLIVGASIVVQAKKNSTPPTSTQVVLSDSIATDSLATDSLTADSILLPPQQATLVFDRQEYHLGTLYNNTQPATYSFFYCNVGIDALVIRRIEATCGCQVTQYTTDSLYYDQSGSIDVAVAPCQDETAFKKGIYVYTNAGTYKLVLSGQFAQPNYSHEDYSAIPTPEEEEN